MCGGGGAAAGVVVVPMWGELAGAGVSQCTPHRLTALPCERRGRPQRSSPAWALGGCREAVTQPAPEVSPWAADGPLGPQLRSFSEGFHAWRGGHWAAPLQPSGQGAGEAGSQLDRAGRGSGMQMILTSFLEVWGLSPRGRCCHSPSPSLSLSPSPFLVFPHSVPLPSLSQLHILIYTLYKF